MGKIDISAHESIAPHCSATKGALAASAPYDTHQWSQLLWSSHIFRLFLQSSRSFAVRGLRSEEGCLNPHETYKCTLCPWRKFSPRSYLLTHVQKYHKPEKDFVTTKYQFHVACAIFEQKQAWKLKTRHSLPDSFHFLALDRRSALWPSHALQTSN